MPRAKRPLISALALCAFTLASGSPACGDDSLEQAPPKAYSIVLKPLSLTNQSTYPDSLVRLRVVALETAGKDIENRGDIRPAVGEQLSWSLVGVVPDDVALSTSSSQTNSAGITEVSLDVGSDGGRSYQVLVTSRTAEPVTFNVEVLSQTLSLEVLAANPVNTVVDRQESIAVRLVRTTSGSATRVPVANTTLTATLRDGPFSNGASLVSPDGAFQTLTTDAVGVARVGFNTGTTPQVGYNVVFCDAATCPGISAASITINVSQRGTGGTGCRTLEDCNPGLACIDGSCTTPNDFCDDNDDCGPGYSCNAGSGICEEDPTDPGGCDSNTDCPAGTQCDLGSGICENINPGAPALDVRGIWHTRYHFDISDTLPGILGNGLKPVLDFLSLVFWSQLEIDIPIVGDVLEALLDGLIAEFVPPYVPKVVEALRDFIYVFQNLEVEGRMSLVQQPTAPVLGPNINGDEVWDRVLVTVPSLCPGGPAQFAQDPSCAHADILLDSVIEVDYSNNDPTVGVRVDPFTGKVLGERLYLYGRDVELAARQLVNVVLDLITSVASDGAYYDFEVFLVDVVPCAELQFALDDLACDITGGSVCALPGVEAACTVAAALATQALSQELGEIPVGFDIEFDAWAKIHDQPAGGATERLGSLTNPADTSESALQGGTDILFLGGDLDSSSWWYGER